MQRLIPRLGSLRNRPFAAYWMAIRLDLALVIILVVVAAVLRLVLLGGIPPGFHGDEGIAGIEARRILDTGWIGPQSPLVGMKAGTLYWTAGFTGLLGDSGYVIRFAYAVLGIITIPIAYFAFKVMFNRTVGFIGALLLAVSAWHIIYSRVAFAPISWPLIEVAVMLALFYAIRRESRALFAVSGALAGFGIYTYGGYPTFAVAVGVFLVWLAIFHFRARLLHYAPLVAVMIGLAVFTGLPMASFARDNPAAFKGRYETYAITNQVEYQQANLFDRGRIVAEREWDYIQAVTDPDPGDADGVDAAGLFPLVNRVMQGLLIIGGAMAMWRWRSPAHAFLIIGIVAIALGPAVTFDAQFRRTVGLTPLLSGLAALPLAYVWDQRNRWGRIGVLGAGVGVAIVIGSIALIDLTRYFGTYDDDPRVRWVYAAEIAEASKFMNGLPADTFVYFYSARWNINYETRQGLAPDVIGEDRSREWGTFDLTPDRSREVAYVFLPPYIEQADEVERLYPDGSAFSSRGPDGAFEFRAYLLPPVDGAVPPVPQPPPAGDGAAAPTATAEAPGAADARDLSRRQDLAAIQLALEMYRGENGSYPSTGGAVQSFCVFPELDAGCALAEVLDPLPKEPLGDPVANGYWYASDGEQYAVYALRESDRFPACTAQPDHLAGLDSVLCVQGP